GAGTPPPLREPEPILASSPTTFFGTGAAVSKPNLQVVEGGQQPGDVLPATDSALFERFAPYVARIGLRLLGRESDVDDLIQEVFLAAFRQRHQVREPQAFKSWLAIIAVRTARRQLRRRRMRAFVGLDTLAAPLELRDQSM